MSLDVALVFDIDTGNPEVSETADVYEFNITHNLGAMAKEAQLYNVMWRPDESSIKEAGELVGHLQFGLGLLRANPKHFKKLNPKNGRGDYDYLVKTVNNYLLACKKYPKARIEVSR